MEVGAVRVENGVIVQKYSQLVDPEEKIPYFISNLTGISDNDIWGKPTFKHIAQDIESMLSGAIFVAHNVNFDYSFLRMEFSRLGIAFNHDRLCTVRLSRALYPQYKSHRLDSVIERHGYTVASRHRAYDDAEVLYKFFSDSYQTFGLDLFRHMNHLLTTTRS